MALWASVAALMLAGCSVAGHTIGIPATVQCPTQVPSIHPGRATPRKFALTDHYVRADVCGYRNAGVPVALKASAMQTDKAWIAGVVRDLNALPVPSKGTYSCPSDNGEFDLLRLYTGTDRVDVHVDLGGCGFVVGPKGMDGFASPALRDALAAVVA